MFGSGMNLITTIIGFGMSATFIVFVCTRLICGRLRRVEERQMLEIESRIDLELLLTWSMETSSVFVKNMSRNEIEPGHMINGLEPVVVAAIPTMNFNREVFSSVEDAQCTICLAEYQEKEVLRIMPNCGHSFHLSCIDTWLRKQSTCPVCRLSVQDSFETKHLRTARLSMTQSFNSRAEGVEDSPRHEDSISIELEPGISGNSRLR